MHKLLILPALGEFGCYVGAFTRHVHSYCQTNDVVVCCRKGDEWLFPAATDHLTQFDADFLLDGQRCGYYADGVVDAERQVSAYLSAIAQFAAGVHPQRRAVRLGFAGFTPLAGVDLPLLPQCVAVDGRRPFVGLSPRMRVRGGCRNLSESLWREVLDGLHQLGVSAYLLGKGDSSLWVDHPAVCGSTYQVKPQYLNLICARVLQESLAFVGSDSGLAHLADILDRPSLLLSNGLDTELPFLTRSPRDARLCADVRQLLSAIETRRDASVSAAPAG